jgi:hypothetical protein
MTQSLLRMACSRVVLTHGLYARGIVHSVHGSATQAFAMPLLSEVYWVLRNARPLFGVHLGSC